MPYTKAIARNNPYFALGEMSKIAPGILGHLIPEGDRRVCVPTFYSLRVGKGNVGRFIDDMKTKYDVIRFPNIINPILEGMLTRRGFKRKREHVAILGGHVEVFVWKNKNTRGKHEDES